MATTKVPSKKTAVKKIAKTPAAVKKPVPVTAKSPVKKPAPAGKTVAATKKGKITQKKAPLKKNAKKVSADLKRYRCKLCGYIYSPFRGEPHNGIPAGTAFDDLPDTYVCPVCGQQGKGKIGKWGFDEWRPTRYMCSICNYVYDEKRGEPHRGIKPGTKFEDLPEDYVCPVCAQDAKIRVQFGKVLKQGFQPLNI
jgi:rubredoxin